MVLTAEVVIGQTLLDVILFWRLFVSCCGIFLISNIMLLVDEFRGFVEFTKL